MTTIPPERVKDIRDSVENHITEPGEDWLETINYHDLLAILDDYSAMRAGNDRLLVKSISDNEALKALKTATADRESLRRLLREALASAQDKAAELAKQAPLIEAVMGATLYDSEAPGVTMLEFGEQAERAILRAALALRGTK